jgi:hypothetical protein
MVEKSLYIGTTRTRSSTGKSCAGQVAVEFLSKADLRAWIVASIAWARIYQLALRPGARQHQARYLQILSFLDSSGTDFSK